MRFLTLILISLIYFNGASAQDSTYNFSLQEAKEYAIKHNKTLMNATADLVIAHEKFKETRGAGLPQVSGSMDYMTNFGYEFDFNIGGGSSTTPPDIDYTLLDFGDYELLKFLNQMMAPSEGSTIVMEDQANANFQITQLIFSKQYWIGLQMSKTAKKIAELNYQSTEADIRESVTNSYLLILITQELSKIINDNEENLTEVLKHTNDMFNAGIAEQTDVDQIQITLSQLKNSKRSMERNLQLNYTMMKFIMSVEAEKDIVLTDDLCSFTDKIESLEMFNIEQDIRKNPTYQLINAQEELGVKQVEMQRWAYGPTLSGFYSHKEKLLTSGFDLSPKDAAGLTLSIPIYSGGVKKAKLNQAEIELDKTKRNILLFEEQLNLQSKQLLSDLESAYENYTTQKENVGVAKRVFENIHNKYTQGMVSSLDLTQANLNYLQAENNYISSIMDVLLSKLKLDKLYNNL